MQSCFVKIQTQISLKFNFCEIEFEQISELYEMKIIYKLHFKKELKECDY